ncbi:hypothetical protein [Neotabrizicola sp. VNH66]|uniref:hypothetical protein n=1 Tax=Neotabrizicola sp. VNH66 TaxID=3400918 RepID=UPI003C01EC67
MRHMLALILSAALALPAAAGPGSEPAPPVVVAEVARLEWGVFCALQAMDRAPAPGTASGWIHVPKGEVSFHWPDRQVVPAALGLAFGVKVTGAKGWETAVGEVRVYRPGRTTPESWASDISSLGATLAFFRFDTESELVPGTWVIEGWDRDRRLYRVEFEVVPGAAVPEITNACGATS